jgi:hypothetical protein
MATLLATTDILTLDQARAWLKLRATDRPAQIAASIKMVTSYFEMRTDRRLMARAYTEDLYSGNGSSELMLREWPVGAITKIEVLTGIPSAGNWDALDLTELVNDPDEPRVIHLRDQVFANGKWNHRIDYTGGYTAAAGADPMPQALRLAAVEAVQLILRHADRQDVDVASFGAGGQSVSYLNQALSKRTQAVLDAESRMVVG